MSFATYTKRNTLGIHPNFGDLTRVHWSAMALSVITGGVHLYLYWTQSFVPFLLAGLGFLILAGLLATTFDRRLLTLGGILFTLAQIGAWISLGMPDFMLGVADKTVQILLICVLAYLFVSERNAHKRASAQSGSERASEVSR